MSNVADFIFINITFHPEIYNKADGILMGCTNILPIFQITFKLLHKLNSIVGQFSRLKFPYCKPYSFHFLMFIFCVLCRISSKMIITSFSLPPQKITKSQLQTSLIDCSTLSAKLRKSLLLTLYFR